MKMQRKKDLTKQAVNDYNKIIEIHCDCGQIIAKKDDEYIYLYCKKCKRQIPIKIAPEP